MMKYPYTKVLARDHYALHWQVHKDLGFMGQNHDTTCKCVTKGFRNIKTLGKYESSSLKKVGLECDTNKQKHLLKSYSM